MGSWRASQGRRQKFTRTSRKSSYTTRSVFGVFRDLGGFSGLNLRRVLETPSERVLRRVLKRCLAVGWASEGGRVQRRVLRMGSNGLVGKALSQLPWG